MIMKQPKKYKDIAGTEVYGCILEPDDIIREGDMFYTIV